MNLFPENDFGIGIMDTFVKFELRIFARFFDGPSGEAAGHFGYVLLGVAAVNAEGVKLHQFAPIILVQTPFLLLLVPGLGVLRYAIEAAARPLAHGAFLAEALGRTGVSAQVIIEVEKHGRAFRRVGNEILELAKGVRSDYVAFVRREVIAVFALTGKHVEVIEP